ncbi:nucleotidyltransferase substrate binding protein [Curvibacter sp. APW13]|uniref:nucleotidyltransferase substrate binding protein n=1 Tax=Curvibacter sp. APW13 TaxID=3077236 RepID=UPI0028DE8407|nr:nucleotidyltransferase substrate binding protein [Curvibacter sp. APW13]MDT8990749.1 nucleotidyltransferase substrate binding protein [Curvibacter sp. APW13]
MNQEDIRWKQRFSNFQRAFLLLREMREREVKSFSQLEKEGAIQRFEFAFELAWKVLKDYLEAEGVQLESNTPRQVIKQAFAAGLLPDAQTWIDIMLLRNKLSHTYDQQVFEQALHTIRDEYFPAFERLYDEFVVRSLQA